MWLLLLLVVFHFISFDDDDDKFALNNICVYLFFSLSVFFSFKMNEKFKNFNVLKFVFRMKLTIVRICQYMCNIVNAISKKLWMNICVDGRMFFKFLLFKKKKKKIQNCKQLQQQQKLHLTCQMSMYFLFFGKKAQKNIKQNQNVVDRNFSFDFFESFQSIHPSIHCCCWTEFGWYYKGEKDEI